MFSKVGTEERGFPVGRVRSPVRGIGTLPGHTDIGLEDAQNPKLRAVRLYNARGVWDRQRLDRYQFKG